MHAYCVQTALTQADETILAFTRHALPDGLNTPDDAPLARAICDRVAYEPGMTDVTTAANQVLAMGHARLPDHAHLFWPARAAWRARALRQRYLYTTAEHAASHAWADIWLPGAGWTSVDITNRRLASECHCRLAVRATTTRPRRCAACAMAAARNPWKSPCRCRPRRSNDPRRIGRAALQCGVAFPLLRS